MITRRGSRIPPRRVTPREPDAPSPAHHRTSDYVPTNGSAFNVSMLDDLGWHLAEQAAEVKPASAVTRQEVIKTLQEAEDYRAAMFNTVMGQAR